MQPLILYPLKLNLQKGLASGLGALGLGAYLIMLDTDTEWFFIGIIGVILGLHLTVTHALALANPSPVFEADAQGFSVKRGAKRPWSEFRGVEVYRVRSGMMTVSRTVRIKVGKTMLGGAKQIKWSEMSASPTEMCNTIGRYAEGAQGRARADHMEAAVTGARSISAQPVAPARPARKQMAQPAAAPEPVMFEQRSFAQRLQDTNGPVQSTPRLSERLFGRRKVI